MIYLFAIIGACSVALTVGVFVYIIVSEALDHRALRRQPKPPVLQYPPIEQCTHPLHHRTLHVDAESDAQALDAITRRVK